MDNPLRALFPLSLFATLTAGAQITITEADMLEAGDTVRFSIAGATEEDLLATGPAHMWDFGSLIPMAEGADTAVSVGSTPLLYQFYFNNPFLYPEHDADLALRGAAFDFQAVAMQDVYDYYKVDEDGFRNVGFGATINGLPASVQRQPVDRVHRFPLAFGDQDGSSSEFHIGLPGIGYFGQEQTRYNDVDGWGTLYLPADTFEVLRVTSRIARTDTLFVEQFGIGFSVPEPETIEYKWLAQGMDQPVLQVTSIGGVPALIRFHHDPDDITTGIASAEAASPVRVAPNPATEVVRIGTDGTGGTYEVRAADGRTVRLVSIAPGVREQVEEVRSLAPGAYTIGRPGGTRVTRFVVAR